MTHLLSAFYVPGKIPYLMDLTERSRKQLSNTIEALLFNVMWAFWIIENENYKRKKPNIHNFLNLKQVSALSSSGQVQTVVN